jgi:hypothetical protein
MLQQIPAPHHQNYAQIVSALNTWDSRSAISNAKIAGIEIAHHTVFMFFYFSSSPTIMFSKLV